MITIKEYYENYLKLHQNKNCRRLHVIGNILTLIYFCICLVYQKWIMILFTPLVVYPFAWAGHLFFEKNKPAAWSNPVLAKICDWIMIKDILVGKIKW